MPGMTRVMIVDDHAVVREGLKMILEGQEDISVVAEAGDDAGTLTRAREQPMDVILLDVSLPGRSGLEILKQLRYQYPDLAVLMLSIHPEDQYAVRFLRAGASGYMTKETAPAELVAAIRKVANGGRYVSQVLAECLVEELERPDTAEPHTRLSDREYQLLVRIGQGLKPAQIAEELHVSTKTISTYRSRLLEKMGLSSNAELVQYAVRQGLVD
ncbi:two component transcriptional regulator, LuxR family [Thiohalospira halophila DSM 15071]|uniref:Two component transcriptional regulator, LuxR family n=2 Tax=Thiohalospira halophila TaxID=381300 RepID=A0A1I1QB53_9GAMM|nr:response regulator transcription factor [Thiohalospira halophila]SFD16453.1 two component transcriptional regulator, LuxR family [Thiohalospira halophila DSM 15071]